MSLNMRVVPRAPLDIVAIDAMLIHPVFDHADYALILLGAFSGCAANVPVPDFCDMPPGFRTWHNAHVVWSGFVMDATPHGIFLACERRRRSIQLDWQDDISGQSAFEDALDRTRYRPGLLRIEVTGRLKVHDGHAVLDATSIRHIHFTPMRQSDMENFIERRGDLGPPPADWPHTSVPRRR
jgi:hypothetical protein